MRAMMRRPTAAELSRRALKSQLREARGFLASTSRSRCGPRQPCQPRSRPATPMTAARRSQRPWPSRRRLRRRAAALRPLLDGSPATGMQWVLRRNCSITPRQLVASTCRCAVSLAIAGAFWWRGAPSCWRLPAWSCWLGVALRWSTRAMPPIARPHAGRPGAEVEQRCGSRARPASSAPNGCGRAGARRRLAGRAVRRGPADPASAASCAPSWRARWPRSCALALRLRPRASRRAPLPTDSTYDQARATPS